MELENLKQSWQDYDQKLNDTLKLNETLLKQLNLDKSKRELGKPLLYEIISVVLAFIMLCLFTATTIRLWAEIKFLIPGILASVLSLIFLIASAIKVKRFTAIDYYNAPVLQLQKDVNQLKYSILRFRKLELFLVPLLLVSIFPILFYSIHGIDLYQNIPYFLTTLGIAIGLSYLAMIWVNKQLYDKKLRNTEQFLKEIERFETE